VNPLDLLEGPLRSLLDFLHQNVNLTYGWSIVVLTIIVRLCLLPLVIKQYASMRRMQAVAPLIKELQAKYKGNRAKLNEELMAFYKKEEINPFSSCLPLVAQLPVFIALYYVLKSFAKDASVNSGAVSFMWAVPDVREQLTNIGWGAFVIVAIYALSQLLSTELSATPNMPVSQRRIMRFLPLVVVLFVFQFPVPAGLVIYWMTTNLWTAGQQLVMRHRIGLHLADPAEAPAAVKKGSRTAPKADTAGGVALADGASDDDGPAEGAPIAEEAVAAPRTTPRKRRRWRPGDAPAEASSNGGGQEAAEGEHEAPEVVPEELEAAQAPEALDAPEAEEAPEPQDAPEADEAPEPREAPGERAPVEASATGTTRRRPPPKGPTRPARPASATRSKKRKKRK
jgi:YidC/Oxa1 family membrane protein insertase